MTKSYHPSREKRGKNLILDLLGYYDIKEVITDIARGEADLDTLKAGASLIPVAKITKVPKVVKAIGNVGKTGFKKGKEGEKISKSGQAKQTKAKNKGERGAGESKTLNDWLKDDPELLEECNNWYKNNPEWWGIDPDNTQVFYRTPDEVAEIRKLAGESGGHHPHGLALGGPIGQKLTQTGETRKFKNPTHSQVTGLQRKVINKIKNK